MCHHIWLICLAGGLKLLLSNWTVSGSIFDRDFQFWWQHHVKWFQPKLVCLRMNPSTPENSYMERQSTLICTYLKSCESISLTCISKTLNVNPILAFAIFAPITDDNSQDFSKTVLTILDYDLWIKWLDYVFIHTGGFSSRRLQYTLQYFM